MKRNPAWTVARIDLARLFKSRDYWVPMMILAGLFFVAIPWVMLGLVSASSGNQLVSQIGNVIDALPGPIQENIEGDTPQAQAAYAFAVYLLAPIAIIVPLTISSAVGAHTIVGERERGTGEFLAHSPLSERDIYLGKLLASLIPGFLATAVGFGLYSLIVNIRVAEEVGGWFFPTAGWWLLIFWVVPPFIAIALSIIVWVSSKVRSTAAAQQAASLVSLPVILASYGVSSGLLYDPTAAALLVGAFAWIVALIGLAAGSRALNRERLLGVGLESAT